MFHDFSMAQTGSPRGNPPAAEVSRLIRRYPNLSELETARLINLYRELPALEVALMISDEKLAPKLDRFVTDNRGRLGAPLRQYAALIAIAMAGVGLTLWALLA